MSFVSGDLDLPGGGDVLRKVLGLEGLEAMTAGKPGPGNI